MKNDPGERRNESPPSSVQFVSFEILLVDYSMGILVLVPLRGCIELFLVCGQTNTCFELVARIYLARIVRASYAEE